MATIAKLDSNGVQVLPEGNRGKTTSPQVHSSTDMTTVTHDGMCQLHDKAYEIQMIFLTLTFLQ